MHGPDRAGEHLLLRDLRMSDATVILNALLLLSVVQPALLLVGLNRTATWASRLIGQPISAARPTLNDTELERMARLIHGCCRRWPFRASCLDRSLVDLVLLGRRGVPVALVVGFRKVGEDVKGHAWVEYRGRRLAENDGFAPGSDSGGKEDEATVALSSGKWAPRREVSI
jgi:hypothetical protein